MDLEESFRTLGPRLYRYALAILGSASSADAEEAVQDAFVSLADPDWFLKTRLGQGGEVRRCTYTNYCEGLDQMHKQVTCKLWDREGTSAPGVKLSADGRRRLTAPGWKA